ncbi:gamma-glutamyltransferase [Ornithinimicrobium flavum]|uniref:gamma-glutamyltransferase n=1 Tax=Ornithinimicrobium flavum TaxID=1288636 RepID=UPI001EE83C68|nr:gamma-glutamyltransferase [Ornithinimicrobium flavum]
MTRRAAIAAPNAYATEAARQALDAGGTAVDAAVAAMLTATVTEPGVVSTLGGCFVNVWVPGHTPVVVDGNVEMPGRAMSPDAAGGG